ncbi:MAG: prepilin-type N-terminal cleavage/methylation domain-containing protein [Candidatus Omnitrophica bacterium]|nr:prepilin-type N-terminal cleavage/methylation domain-containing protein [Candidatus Omnitrophota bacterium]
MRTRQRGFTLVEILLTLLVVSIIMIPFGLMMMEYVRSIGHSNIMVAAGNLAEREMAIVNSKTHLDAGSPGDPRITFFPNYAGYNYDLQRSIEQAGREPKLVKIEITAYLHGSDEQIVKLIAYRKRDLDNYGEYQADYRSERYGSDSVDIINFNEPSLTVAKYGNTIIHRYITFSIDIRHNGTTGPVDITGAYVTVTGSSCDYKGLFSVVIGGHCYYQDERARYMGTITFDRPFQMAADTTYSGSNAAMFKLEYPLTVSDPMAGGGRFEVSFKLSDSSTYKYEWHLPAHDNDLPEYIR